MRRIAGSTILALAVTGAAACSPAEETDRQPPGEELQTAAAAEAGAAERVLGAPARAISEAVDGAALEIEEGEATFYADTFEGRRTASGRTFRQAEMVAAHRAFPFGTRLRVTNLRNDREVEVEVVDRGPFGHDGSLPPVLDLSRAAANRLDFVESGRARVQVEVLEWGP